MKCIFYILLIINLISCKQETKISTKPRPKSYDEQMNIKCDSETKRALKDIKDGNLKYIYFVGNMDYKLSNKEMELLLSKYHIGIDTAAVFCSPDRRIYCYEELMFKEINKKYGKNFIDSLRIKADIMFVKNNPNRIFLRNECDTIFKYPKYISENGKTVSNYEKAFFKFAPLPKSFKLRHGKEFCSWVSAEFIIFKSGEIANLDIDVTFQNEKNNEFKEYYANKAREFISKRKWIPSSSMGIIVNSKAEISFTFEGDKPLLLK